MYKITNQLVNKLVKAALDEAVLGLEESANYLESYHQEEYDACIEAQEWVKQLKESITSS